MRWTAIPLGLVIRLRHAVDPDPVVAVSAIAAREGRPWRASNLAASTLPTPAAELLYLAAFGLETIMGTVAFSTLVGAPVALLGRVPRLECGMTAATGAACLALGTCWLLDCTRQAASAGAV